MARLLPVIGRTTASTSIAHLGQLERRANFRNFLAEENSIAMAAFYVLTKTHAKALSRKRKRSCLESDTTPILIEDLHVFRRACPSWPLPNLAKNPHHRTRFGGTMTDRLQPSSAYQTESVELNVIHKSESFRVRKSSEAGDDEPCVSISDSDSRFDVEAAEANICRPDSCRP